MFRAPVRRFGLLKKVIKEAPAADTGLFASIFHRSKTSLTYPLLW